jgi:hypothetical protein
MNDTSQIGQSTFARICCPNPGYFVDIGANHPDFVSNTKDLLEEGWVGYGMDVTDYSNAWSKYPGMTFETQDATQADWSLLGSRVHYLSIDVDEATLEALARFFATAHTLPVCATIEYDGYKLGDSLKPWILKIMGELGYVLVADLWEYELWFVSDKHPLVNRIAIGLSEWWGVKNSNVELIPEFKNHLKNLFKELHSQYGENLTIQEGQA